MPDILLFASAVAVGFVAAALLAAIYRGVTSRPVSFNAQHPGNAEQPGPMATVAAYVFRILVGPAIIVRQSVASVQSGDVPSSWAAAGVMVATVWSGCLGIAIIAIVGRLIA